MKRRLLTIFAVVVLAALVHLWPLETFLGAGALVAVGLALVLGAASGFVAGQAAEQEAQRQRRTRSWADKHPTSEPEALAACISTLDSVPERQQMRIAVVLHDRYYAEGLEKRTERALLQAAATSRARLQ